MSSMKSTRSRAKSQALRWASTHTSSHQVSDFEIVIREAAEIGMRLLHNQCPTYMFFCLAVRLFEQCASSDSFPTDTHEYLSFKNLIARAVGL
jgi:hypothetical protein